MAYLFVMANYYNMPEDTTLLVVEDSVFPIYNARYFNVTILNPSNSVSDANITAIRLNVEEKKEVYNITEAEPILPYLLRRGTRQTFRCEKNWSNFTGQVVKIEPVAENVSTTRYSCTTPKVRLTIVPSFDASIGVGSFNLTIANAAESIINLTISEINLLGMPINENVTPTLPHLLNPGETETFLCSWNWENYLTLTITVKTEEGYQTSYVAEELPYAVVYIDEIRFDDIDSNYFDLTVANSEDSTSSVTLTSINLTLQDGKIVPINITIPPLTEVLLITPNHSEIFKCLWDWTAYRNKTIAVNCYTGEGFTIPSKNVTTPSNIVWNLTSVEFDLDFLGNFSVKVANAQVSLQNLTIARMEFNGTEVTIESEEVPIAEERLFNCTFDWKDYKGTTANITVVADDGSEISRMVAIPSVGLKMYNIMISEADIPEFNLTRPYINFTVSNSENSDENVTITEIMLVTKNSTYMIYGALTHPEIPLEGYLLAIGEKAAFAYLWDWDYIGSDLTITVHTAEGFQVSETVYPSFPS